MSDAAATTPPAGTTTPQVSTLTSAEGSPGSAATAPENQATSTTLTSTQEVSPSETDKDASLLGKETPPEPEPFSPEKITFPDGVSKDDALFTDFANLATEHKLTAPVAQAFIDLAAKQVQAATQRQNAEWATQNETWQAEVKADKEIGGDKLERSLQTFSKVASDPKLSDPDLRKALAFTGAGNHPAIVRTLVKWAAALSEGGAVRGNPANETRRPQSIGEAMYGPSGPHTGGPKFS